jgi:hypothetical protein
MILPCRRSGWISCSSALRAEQKNSWTLAEQAGNCSTDGAGTHRRRAMTCADRELPDRSVDLTPRSTGAGRPRARSDTCWTRTWPAAPTLASARRAVAQTRLGATPVDPADHRARTPVVPWCTAEEICDDYPGLHAWLEQKQINSVMAISCDQCLSTAEGPARERTGRPGVPAWDSSASAPDRQQGVNASTTGCFSTQGATNICRWSPSLPISKPTELAYYLVHRPAGSTGRTRPGSSPVGQR